VVIQLDMERDVASAQRLSIHAMPTVVALKLGIEVDRMTGLMKTSELIKWVELLERGDTSLHVLEVEAATGDLRARLRMAEKLVEMAQFERALEECVWLWENMARIDPSMFGARHSFFLGTLGTLVAEHPPAREAFSALRDAAEPSLDGLPDVQLFMDWMTLSKLLGTGRQTPLQWFDAWFPKNAELIDGDSYEGRRLSRVLEREIGASLIAAERWADLGAIVRAPLETLLDRAEMVEGTEQRFAGDASNEKLVEHMRESLRTTACDLVRALVAAGRVDEAGALADEAMRVDPSDVMKDALAAVVMPELH
jgi:hypothetical protein